MSCSWEQEQKGWDITKLNLDYGAHETKSDMLQWPHRHGRNNLTFFLGDVLLTINKKVGNIN